MQIQRGSALIRLFLVNNILNIYQLNILNNLLFLHRVKNGKPLNVFLSKFLRSSHHYPTSFSRSNHIVPTFKKTKSNCRITKWSETME